MQGNSEKGLRKRASTPAYVSPNQLVLRGFLTCPPPCQPQKIALDNDGVMGK